MTRIERELVRSFRAVPLEIKRLLALAVLSPAEHRLLDRYRGLTDAGRAKLRRFARATGRDGTHVTKGGA